MIIRDDKLLPYLITVEEDQYTLSEEKVVKEGKTKGQVFQTTIGYYSQLDNALKEVARRKTIANRETSTLREYIEEMLNYLKELNTVEF